MYILIYDYESHLLLKTNLVFVGCCSESGFKQFQVVRGSSSDGEGTRGLLTGLLGQTDMVRGKRGYINGIHMWEIHWPKEQRGSHSVIGVATTEAPLTCIGKNNILVLLHSNI